ncbi:hypothetical protein NBRC116591_37650 [Sessilibacter corallicola]|uniref:Uncharacterized protein n=1 Tax=Sessilibacter corallicola TaxID=2904075 RepID=A0ABQ0AE70_9GAMM
MYGTECTPRIVEGYLNFNMPEFLDEVRNLKHTVNVFGIFNVQQFHYLNYTCWIEFKS